MTDIEQTPTAALRGARAHLRQALARIADRVGAVRDLPAEVRTPAMEHVIDELSARLRPHLQWEERTIHPIVDRFACEGPAVFSTSMRYEHAIIYRALDELRAQASDAAAVVAFTRRADNLLGVVLAHLELEEEVLFPILDQALRRGAYPPITPPPPGGAESPREQRLERTP